MNKIVTVSVAAAIPVAPLSIAAAAPSIDPIFAAIENHRRAVKAVEAACVKSRRLQKLANRRVGPNRISVLDMRPHTEGTGWHPYVDACSLADIDDLVPGEQNRELRDCYVQYWARLQDKRESFTGDLDAIIDEPASDEFEAAQELVYTVPTTVAGLLALLTYAATVMERDRDRFNSEQLAAFTFACGSSAKVLASKTA